MSHKFKLMAAALTAAAMLGSAAQAQNPTVEASRESRYAAIARLSAFEGVWQPDWAAVTNLRAAEGQAPMTASARATVDAFNAAKADGQNLQTEGANCMPVGMPGVMRYPYPIEFIYSPGKVNIVIETHSQVRRIFTDGRPLPEDPDLLFNGSSVGHWEGETLVADTVGLSPLISLLPGLHPTENTRIHERIKLDGPGKLVVETTITDPELFTQPFVTSLSYRLEPDWDIREYICQENNRDAADAEGRPSMDLGFDEIE
ncbi:hypothetical protein SZ64_09610 [Erythrobacter sp. SG61-1L]|uniref:hypothetical protein n=1 Tax=Erythrobacter sp. SG61-1L TaxID=1603897 RepID=UPI0006C8F814|nr:hypothetical protein [Erythrobacter sp. SG61-1L]KPL68353.1 hypothetical protein SZ64_09610 [Erythrobacter sp. SG61-1L]